MSVKIYDKKQKRWVIFPGTIGAPGKDAYLIAQENGYTGTKDEYNQVLVAIPNIINSIESTPTENSDNLITSGGVWQSIQDVRNDFPTAGTMTPQVAGEANVGVSNSYAREDHVHPAQTSISGNAETATKLANARTIELMGSVNGSASFDGSQDIIINNEITAIDASKITSGTIDIERLPKGALERLVIVENQAARFALTSEDVQEGDTVKQEDTGVMYYVVNINNLSSEEGYKVYTAGAATSVPWSGITDKPKFLQLGETSDTAYAGDKGKLTTDIVNSLGTDIVNDIIDFSADTDNAYLNIKKSNRTTINNSFTNDLEEQVVIPAATAEKSGIMTAADKIKLDNLDQSIADAVSDAKEYTDGEIAKEASAREAADETVLNNTKEYTNTAVDNMQIGGVNLLDGSEHISILRENGGIAYIGTITLKKGQTYIYHFASYSGVATGGLYLNTEYPRWDLGISQYIYPNTPFVANADHRHLLAVCASGSQNGDAVGFERLMLEEGNKETSWSPSLNDQKAYVDKQEYSSINLINNSESVRITAPYNSNNYWYTFYFDTELSPGDAISIHFDKIRVAYGNFEQIQVAIYDSSITSLFNTVKINVGTNQSATLIGLDNYVPSGSGSALLIYPGINGSTSENSIEVNGVMLTKGTKACPSWAPSVEDNKPYILTLNSLVDTNNTISVDKYNDIYNAVKSNKRIFYRVASGTYYYYPIITQTYIDKDSIGSGAGTIQLQFYDPFSNTSTFNKILIKPDRTYSISYSSNIIARQLVCYGKTDSAVYNTTGVIGSIDDYSTPMIIKAVPANSNWNVQFAGDQTLLFGTQGGIPIQIFSNGSQSKFTATIFNASDGFYETSDERLKNIKDSLSIDINKLSQLQKFYFTFKNDKTNKVQIGVSAQEVQQIYPELVYRDSNGYLSVDYAKLSVIALSAIDTLNQRLIKLESCITKIEDSIKSNTITTKES